MSLVATREALGHSQQQTALASELEMIFSSCQEHKIAQKFSLEWCTASAQKRRSMPDIQDLEHAHAMQAYADSNRRFSMDLRGSRNSPVPRSPVLRSPKLQSSYEEDGEVEVSEPVCLSSPSLHRYVYNRSIGMVIWAACESLQAQGLDKNESPVDWAMDKGQNQSVMQIPPLGKENVDMCPKGQCPMAFDTRQQE